MQHLPVLTPVVLLLLMVVLGRLEHWLDESTPPQPPRASDRRWRRTARAARTPSSVRVPPGRRLLTRRGRPQARPPVGSASATSTPAPAARRRLPTVRARRRVPR